jgi:uncharacterized protein RhaS with RHS repeats
MRLEHYNYFRDYDPAIGRYIESDPIGLRGGLSTFGYVDGNPLKLVDPFGLCESPPPPPWKAMSYAPACLDIRWSRAFGLNVAGAGARQRTSLSPSTWGGRTLSESGHALTLIDVSVRSVGCATFPLTT